MTPFNMHTYAQKLNWVEKNKTKNNENKIK